jgi:hypothetical protein
LKTIGLRQLYEQHGFILVPQVLSSEEVAKLRAHLDLRFAEHGNPSSLLPSQSLSDPRLYEVLLREPVVRALKELFGDGYTLFTDFSAARNGFGRPGELHHDADAEGAKRYLQAANYRFAKCGVYLQDNLPEWGGGVTITPDLHRFPIRTPFTRIDFVLKRMRDGRKLRKQERWVDLKAGDLLIFDSRLPHQSAFPSRYAVADVAENGTLDLPPEHTKYVLYWNACAGDSYVPEFTAHMGRRAARGEKLFIDAASLRYPEDFPADLVARLTREGVRVAPVPATP